MLSSDDLLEGGGRTGLEEETGFMLLAEGDGAHCLWSLSGSVVAQG